MDTDTLQGRLEFLRQAEKLKDVLRSAHSSGGRQESTAEHTWRLCLIAMGLEDGHAKIRARHLERFQEPDLHGRLVNRIVNGDIVVDQEIVTRTFADGPGEIRVVAIYEVRGPHIAQAWFRLGQPRLHPRPA